MLARVCPLSSVILGSFLVGCCATAQSPPSAPIKEHPRVEKLAPGSLPDAEIALLLLKASRAAYPGNCPCPDDRDRAGRRCGGRSAYSRPGGYAPLCYPHDV